MASSSSSTVVKFDEKDPDQGFFLCLNCGNHIILVKAFALNEPQAKIGIFENEAVNVRVDEEGIWKEDDRTYCQVYCNKCETLLGKHFLDVEKEDNVAKKGRYSLFMKKLLAWNGTKMLYAHNWEPFYASKKPAEVVDPKKANKP